MTLELKSEASADLSLPPALRTWIIPFVATLLAMFCLQASNLGFSPLLPSIQREFGQSFSSMGLFKGMYGLISIIVSIPAGLMVRRFGERMILLAGMLVVVLGLSLLSQAPDFAGALTGRAVWLVGYRCAFICVMTAIALTCPKHVRGRCMGILGAMAALSSVIGAPLGAAIAMHFGWRDGVLAFAGLAIAGAVLFALLYSGTNRPSAARTESSGPEQPAASRGAFSNPLVWAVAVLAALSGVASLTANFYIPYAVDQTFGLDKDSAAYIIAVGFLLAVIVNLIFGFLMDRFHKWRVMTGLAVISIAGCLMMTSHELPVFCVGASLVLAFGHAAIQQSYSIAAEVLHGRETGNVMGIVSGVCGVVGYLTPQALGFLRDGTGGFDAGWLTLAALSTIMLVLVLALWRRSTLTSACPDVALASTP